VTNGPYLSIWVTTEKRLADDILRSYGEQIAQFLEDAGRPAADRCKGIQQL
jgi:hypothetical protein